jgi:hypothetical protein
MPEKPAYNWGCPMKREIFGRLVLAVLLFSVLALQVQAEQFTINIPFAFKAGKQSMPAGTYSVEVAKPDATVIRIFAPGGKLSATVPVATRLHADNPPDPNPHLVFDNVDEQRTVAELWLPGMDGFFLWGDPHLHTHVVIKASK